MTSERQQRQIEGLLDEAEAAIRAEDWPTVRQRVRSVLALDPENVDALAYSDAADRAEGSSASGGVAPFPSPTPASSTDQPTSFAGGRYEVKRFLGEGGKKRVYLAHDAQLDRDVAFALIKTEGLDEAARQRITREAQAMGRLGDHPNIVTVYDIGDENGQPYMVLPVLPGGDIEGIIEKAEDHRLPLETAIKYAVETCQGLEFAHSRGIVHRDLKPGNVWLAADGRALIGDLGLAVAMDMSRLTQAGMMVGTPLYMPPEQATASEVGPRSDLYSLGAMLYEMVCGRPPFVGDDFVAIIGQHMNTPPVHPSWHRPDCPPALEALILRLLEKDATKRPASAAEVREALEAIDLSAPVPAAQEDIAVSVRDPLYRRTFVGREQELAQLQQAYDAAVSGQGGLVMVVGEPGIGKTSIVEQLSTYVQLRGGRWLLGHSYEEGSLSLPYLPFIEAMRGYVLERDPEGLRSDLGTGASEVARIVSEVRDKVNVSPSDGGDPEEQRWRLMQAVTGFLRNASMVQPLLLVLEDLHDSDRGTLDVLLHLARNLEGARLLIVGTYRDVEVDRAHPLSSTLAELRRAGAFTRIPLRGLTVDEVHRLYAIIRGQEVSWVQAQEVHRQTEGNPLFIQEFLRYLVEEGLVIRQGGRYVTAEGQGPGSNIPEGLRDVIGKRLSLLSERTNQVLSVAAVIGRDFPLEGLNAVLEMTEDDLIEALEEATERAVIEVRSQVGANLSYRFTHAFFRQTLYEELSPPRRIRIHQQVAQALEQVYGRRVEEHAAELAEHYAYSSDAEDLTKAVEYGELAASRAMAVYAYGEAARHLERALEVQGVLDPDDWQRRCDLLLALGEARLPQDDPHEISRTIDLEAYELSEANGDRNRAMKAVLQACESLYRARGDVPQVFGEIRPWAERAERLATAGTAEQVYADTYFGSAGGTARTPADLHVYLRRAVEGAKQLDDSKAFFTAAGLALERLLAIRDIPLLDDLARDALNRPRENTRAYDVGFCLASVAKVLLCTGDRSEAEKVGEELLRLNEKVRDARLSTLYGRHLQLIANFDGRLEDASSLAAGIRDFAGQYVGMRAAVLLGSPRDDFMREDTARPAQSARAFVLSTIGRHEEAAALRHSERFAGVEDPQDESGIHVLINLFESSILDEDSEMAGNLAQRFMGLADRIAVAEVMGAASIGRLLGDAAMLLGDAEGARHYFEKAQEVCTRARFRPELALARAHLAELLLDHYPDEHDAAIEHLDFAIAEFQDMKMQPALERALGRRGLLKA